MYHDEATAGLVSRMAIGLPIQSTFKVRGCSWSVPRRMHGFSTTNSPLRPRCSSGQPNRRRPQPETSVFAQTFSARSCYERHGRRRKLVPEENIGNTLYKKDFWSKENLKYSRPHYRLEKSARIVNSLAQGKRLALLDVGCGPQALMSLLRANIEYYGIDIAIHDPAPNLIEADLLVTPIRFDDKRFDIVLARVFLNIWGPFRPRNSPKYRSS